MARKEGCRKRRENDGYPGAAEGAPGKGSRDDGCVRENGQREIWLDGAAMIHHHVWTGDKSVILATVSDSPYNVICLPHNVY